MTARDLPAARWDRMRALVEAGQHNNGDAAGCEAGSCPCCETLAAAIPPPIDWADIKRANADADRQIYGGLGTAQRGEP